MERRPANDRASARHDWWWIFDPRHSLRARAALIVGLGAVTFTLGLGWITGVILRRTIELRTADTFEALAVQVSDKLDRTIYERYRALQLGASLAPLRHADTPPADRRRVLEALQETSPEFAWIGLADAGGKIVAATRGLFENTAAGTRPWFRNARESAYVGHLHDFPELTAAIPAGPDGETSQRFLDVAVPVTGTHGEFAGVLVAHVRWGWAREVQLSVVPEPVSRQLIGVTVYSDTGDVLLDSGASGWTIPPEHPSVGDGRRMRGSFFENTLGGSHYLSGFARSRGYRDYRGLGWLTIVRQPLARVLAPVPELRLLAAQWGLVLSGAATVAAWIVAGRFERRLRSVGAAAERMRSGDVLAALPQPHGDTELAHMCDALNKLVDDLRERNRLLAADHVRREREPSRREI